MKRLLRSPLILKSGIVTVDQAVLSAVNFFISIVLIKNVPKVEYGYYAIALPVLLFLISIQNAVVTTPLSVLLVSKKEGDKQRYAGSLYFGQLIALLLSVGLGLVVGAIVLSFRKPESARIFIIATFCIAAVGVLFREFLRAYFFAEETPLPALQLDALYTVCFLSLITLILFFHKINVAAIFVLMGISAFLFSLFFSRNLGWELHRSSIRESYRENWEFGKWALLGVIVTHIQRYCYVYMLAAMLGSTVVADVSASRLFLMPVMLAQTGWSRIAIPYGSRLREQNKIYSYFKLLILASLIFTIALSAYVAVLMIFSDLLRSLLLTEKYQKSLEYLLVWGVIFITMSLSQNASSGLLVMKRFDTVSKLNSLTMLLTVGCAFLLIRSHGVMGGFWALMIGESFLAMALWFQFGKKALRQKREDIKKPSAWKR